MKWSRIHTRKRIPRTDEDDTKRYEMRAFLKRFPAEIVFDFSFGQKIDCDLACKLLDQYFGIVKTVMGIRMLTLGLIVQTHAGETHAHICAKGKDSPLDALSLDQKRQLEDLWRPFGKPILKGAHVQKLLDDQGFLIYLTTERNFDPDNYEIYIGLNRRSTLRLMKVRRTPWPTPVPPFKVVKPPKTATHSPVEKTSTGEPVKDISDEELMRVIYESIELDSEELLSSTVGG